jgi:SLT domain-containing protein
LIGTGISMLTGTANPNIGPPVPGRAAGGPVSAGGLYQINELNRPEVLEVSGKQFLMMGDRAGMVTPNNLTPGGREYLTMGRDGADSGPQTVSNNATSILNVHVTPPAGASRETAMQWGSMAGRQIQAATRRNG